MKSHRLLALNLCADFNSWSHLLLFEFCLSHSHILLQLDRQPTVCMPEILMSSCCVSLKRVMVNKKSFQHDTDVEHMPRDELRLLRTEEPHPCDAIQRN